MAYVSFAYTCIAYYDYFGLEIWFVKLFVNILFHYEQIKLRI